MAVSVSHDQGISPPEQTVSKFSDVRRWLNATPFNFPGVLLYC